MPSSIRDQPHRKKWRCSERGSKLDMIKVGGKCWGRCSTGGEAREHRGLSERFRNKGRQMKAVKKTGLKKKETSRLGRIKTTETGRRPSALGRKIGTIPVLREGGKKCQVFQTDENPGRFRWGWGGGTDLVKGITTYSNKIGALGEKKKTKRKK